MRMARCPRQHGARNSKIIMSPAQTVIETTSLFVYDFELRQLLICPAAHLIIHCSHVTAFYFGSIVLNQSGATAGIDQYDPTRHLPALKVHSVAMPRNMIANDPVPEHLPQLLGIARIITQISNDQSIVIITAIYRRQRIGALRSTKT